jgi:signal transduction histidine kinase
MKKAGALVELKGQLVSIVSHETNNALAVIAGMLTLLQEGEPEATEKRAGYYKLAELCIQSLVLQSQTLLNMGRLESGKLALRMKCVEVRKLVSGCLERLSLLYERKGHEVTLDFPEENLLVRADPDALSLVLMNLLSNAIKYTPERGRIAIGARLDGSDGARARISVSDTGIGIAPEDQERIFSGYYRTKLSRSKATGFGVGLSLARKILEAHASELSVESVPGQGSKFSFSLRRCPSAD